MRTRGDMLSFAIAFALRDARKLVRGLREELTEEERYRVADDIVHRLRQHGDPWRLSEDLPRLERDIQRDKRRVVTVASTAPALASKGGKPVPEENKMSNYYAAVSALIFALVALAHLVRLIKRWTVEIGPYEVSMTVSWVGFVVAALLAIWGFTQLG